MSAAKLAPREGDREVLLGLASAARDVLSAEHCSVSKQCRRAAISIDTLLKQLGYRSQVRAGWVGEPSRDTGHLWNRVTIGGKPYLLDATLSQFSDDVPDVVLGPYKGTLRKYKYIDDGEYEYDYYDVRPETIGAIARRVGV
jgi:hypothetical protein